MHALSGGQKQLLALAGVLATEPDVLVADEPTTLLDLANTRRVGDLLFSLDSSCCWSPTTSTWPAAATGCSSSRTRGCASTGLPDAAVDDYVASALA